jgi:hypothetical protein
MIFKITAILKKWFNSKKNLDNEKLVAKKNSADRASLKTKS